eukprot:g13303.t1
MSQTRERLSPLELLAEEVVCRATSASVVGGVASASVMGGALSAARGAGEAAAAAVTGVSKKTFHIKQMLPCTSANVVYCIRCTHCGLLSIGDTKRRLGECFAEH